MKKTKNRLITFINDSERFFLEDVKDASSIYIFFFKFFSIIMAKKDLLHPRNFLKFNLVVFSGKKVNVK